MTAGPGARVSHESADARVITLRGELWRRHADLGQMDPADARYAEAVGVVLELTDQLLRAETASAEAARVSPPWFRPTIFVLGPLLAVTSVLLAALLPGLGGWSFRAVDAVVPVAVVLVGSWALLRSIRPPKRPKTATTPDDAAIAITEPETGPVMVVEPVEPAR